MRRFITIPVLAIGTVLGYGFAFHAMHHHHGTFCEHEAWREHADVDRGSARGGKGETVKADKPKQENPSSNAETTEP